MADTFIKYDEKTIVDIVLMIIIVVIRSFNDNIVCKNILVVTIATINKQEAESQLYS